MKSIVATWLLLLRRLPGTY